MNIELLKFRDGNPMLDEDPIYFGFNFNDCINAAMAAIPDLQDDEALSFSVRSNSIGSHGTIESGLFRQPSDLAKKVEDVLKILSEQKFVRVAMMFHPYFGYFNIHAKGFDHKLYPGEEKAYVKELMRSVMANINLDNEISKTTGVKVHIEDFIDNFITKTYCINVDDWKAEYGHRIMRGVDDYPDINEFNLIHSILDVTSEK